MEFAGWGLEGCGGSGEGRAVGAVMGRLQRLNLHNTAT